MSNEWKQAVLSDYISVKHGFAFKGEFFSDEPTTDVLVTPGNFALGGGFKSDKYKYYQGAVPEDYVLREDDLVVTMTDLSKQADTLGYSALIPDINGLRFLHNQRIGLVEIKNKSIDKLFLYFLLRSYEYRHHVVSSATGSTVKHTSPSRITSFEFKLPPKHVQKAIGSQLYSLEHKIQLNQQINQTLEEMAQALFKSWFVDFEPTKAKIAALAAGGNEEDANLAAMQAISGKTAAELEQLKTQNPENYQQLYTTAQHFPAAMQESELGEMPEGWEVSTIENEFEVIMGQSPKGDTYNEEKQGTLFYQGRAEFGWRFPSPRLYTTDPKRMANKGDTLMSVRAPVGDLNIALEACCIGRGLAALRHKSDCPTFTYYQIKNIEKQLDYFNSEGTVFGSINQKNLKSIPVIQPSLEVISRFSLTAAPFDRLITTKAKEQLQLISLRDELLPKLLSGELSVADLPQAELAQ